MLPLRGLLQALTSGAPALAGGLGLSLSYSWPCALSVFPCLSPHLPCPLSVSQLCLSSLGPVFPVPTISPCLAGGGAHGSSISGSLFNSDSSFPASDGSGARLSPPSALPSPSQPYLAPGLRPPHLSLFCLRLSESRFSRTLSPSPDRLPATGGQGCPSWGRGR